MAGRIKKVQSEALVAGAAGLPGGAVAQLEGLWLNLSPQQKEWLKKRSKGAIAKLFKALDMKLNDLVMEDKQGIWLRSRTTVNAISQSAIQMMQLWHLAEGGMSMRLAVPDGKVGEYLERVSALRARIEAGGPEAEELARGVMAAEVDVRGGEDDPDGGVGEGDEL